MIRENLRQCASVSQLGNELGFHCCILSAYHGAWHIVDTELRFANLCQVKFKWGN